MTEVSSASGSPREAGGPAASAGPGGRRTGGVEVAVAAGAKEGSHRVITFRNSGDPGGPTLVFTPAEWAAFTAGVKDGEFDLD